MFKKTQKSRVEVLALAKDVLWVIWTASKHVVEYSISTVFGWSIVLRKHDLFQN